MKKGILIYGAGPFGELMRYYFCKDTDCEVLAFTVDKEYLPQAPSTDLPVFSFEEVIGKFPPSKHQIFVSIGYRRMRARKAVFETVKKAGYKCVNYISPAANVRHSISLGENNVLMDGVTVEPEVALGDNNVIWTDSLLCHNVTVGSHNFLSAKTLIGGDSKLKDLSFLGDGVTVINGVNINDETHLLPGSTLFQDTLPHRKYWGNPARDVGEHSKEGIIVERG